MPQPIQLGLGQTNHLQKINFAIRCVNSRQFGIRDKSNTDQSSFSIASNGTVGRDKVVGFEPFFTFKNIAAKVIHQVDSPKWFVWRAIFRIGVKFARCNTEGKFEAPLAEFGISTFRRKVKLAHAVGDDVAVWCLFFAIVDARAVQRIFPAHPVFDDAAVVTRFGVAVEFFKFGIDGVPADGFVFGEGLAVFLFCHVLSLCNSD